MIYEYAIWVAVIMSALGALLLMNILDSVHREDRNAPIRLALMWPYVAIRIIIDRIIYGDDK